MGGGDAFADFNQKIGSSLKSLHMHKTTITQSPFITPLKHEYKEKFFFVFFYGTC